MISLDSAWNLYLATRLHYLKGYDAIKYKGKIRYADKAQERPDKILARASLTGLTDKREVIEFCVANFLNENDNFLYESQDDATEFYSEWKKYWASVDYMLRADISAIEISMYKSGYSLEEYMIHGIHADVLMNRIRRETLCIITHQIPHALIYMKGFGAERMRDRVEKTLPFIKNRLESIQIDIKESLS